MPIVKELDIQLENPLGTLAEPSWSATLELVLIQTSGRLLGVWPRGEEPPSDKTVSHFTPAVLKGAAKKSRCI